MELDEQKIDDAVLALLFLGLHDVWDAMDRLHQQGYISDPRGRAKSVVFTQEGLQRSREVLVKLFGKEPA